MQLIDAPTTAPTTPACTPPLDTATPEWRRPRVAHSARRADHGVPLDIAMAAADNMADHIDWLGFNVDPNTAVWQLHAAAGIIRTLLNSIDAAQADDDGDNPGLLERIPQPPAPSPDSYAQDDRPPLPKRRTTHEDDGRHEQPEPARPHPQLTVVTA